jgi:hypothetical protein
MELEEVTREYRPLQLRHSVAFLYIMHIAAYDAAPGCRIRVVTVRTRAQTLIAARVSLVVA